MCQVEHEQLATAMDITDSGFLPTKDNARKRTGKCETHLTVLQEHQEDQDQTQILTVSIT